MGWTETHTWWHELREVEAEIESRADGILPWRPELAAIFGDRRGLLMALRYTWNLRLQAQAGDVDNVDQRIAAQELIDANRSLLAVLNRGVDHVRVDEPASTAVPSLAA